MGNSKIDMNILAKRVELLEIIQGFVCKILPERCGDFSAKQRPDLVKIRQNRYLRNRILTDSQKSMNEILL